MPHVEFVEDAVISNSQFKFAASFQSFVRELVQASAYIIDFVLNCFLDRAWQ